MKNVFNITKCDNQLIIVAVSSDEQTMYDIARVGSGPAVDVEITLERGNYSSPSPILNPTSPKKETVKLPADTYTIYYSGFNAGGPYNFEFTLNGREYELTNGKSSAKYGFIWNQGGPEKSTITVDV